MGLKMYFWSTSMFILLLWSLKWLSTKLISWFCMLHFILSNVISLSYYWFRGVKNVFLSQNLDLACLIFQKFLFSCIYCLSDVLCRLDSHFLLMLLCFPYWLSGVILMILLSLYADIMFYWLLLYSLVFSSFSLVIVFSQLVRFMPCFSIENFIISGLSPTKLVFYKSLSKSISSFV